MSTTAQQLVQRYERGDKTATDLMLEVLHWTDRPTLREALALLPPEVLHELRRFVRHYRPEVRVFNGPCPKMPTVKFIQNWFATTGKSRVRRAPLLKRPLRTVPIGDNRDFRALQAYADSLLETCGYEQVRQRGSTSWIDPTDDTVRFKLSNCKSGFFFGVREEWANVLAIPVDEVGAEAHSFLPSRVVFRGGYVTNTDTGRDRIAAIVAMFPPAGKRAAVLSRPEPAKRVT
jgi:hypothetical protein